MNLLQVYKAKTVLHIMLYSTIKIIMFKNVNYYKALKKTALTDYSPISTTSRSNFIYSTFKRSQMSSC